MNLNSFKQLWEIHTLINYGLEIDYSCTPVVFSSFHACVSSGFFVISSSAHLLQLLQHDCLASGSALLFNHFMAQKREFCILSKTGLSAGFVILLLKCGFRNIFNNFNILAQKGQNGGKWPFSGFGGKKIKSGHSGHLRGMPTLTAR